MPANPITRAREPLRREPGAKAEHGLRVQLRDARLGHPEHLADLAQGEVLVVVEGDHQALALGQTLDRVREPVLDLGGLGLGFGIDRAGVLDRVEDRDLTATLGIGERPQGPSSASTEELAISSTPWKSSTLISSSADISSSVGARCSFASSFWCAFSTWRARARTERGTQSSERSSSMIAPLIRATAKVSN